MKKNVRERRKEKEMGKRRQEGREGKEGSERVNLLSSGKHPSPSLPATSSHIVHVGFKLCNKTMTLNF